MKPRISRLGRARIGWRRRNRRIGAGLLAAATVAGIVAVGCKYRGTDDGQVERRLTADVLRPLVAFGKPNMPYYGLPEPIWLLIDR
jgi:hypothetical protein